MRKICRSLFAGVILTLSLASCGSSRNLKITDQKSIDEKVKPLLVQTIGADMHVSLLYLFPKEKFTDESQHMSVHYYAPGSDTKMTATIFYDGSVAPKIEKDIVPRININSPYAPKNPTWEDYPTVEELDLSGIAQNLSRAGQMLLDEGNEYSGVGTYVIKGTREDPVQEFTLESRVDSRLTGTNRGLATEISYYVFNFTVDKEGNIKLKD
ncbi:hypothetical protein [uncultured Alistipes sp.]|jgi:lipoprotein|uniref:hypothetical protein n=1 Tax=uncultured Alistipes sp. TaxID=538949 RepID=UPI0025F63B62|nr:hypothetical protein [uncultured Alistipes sp.]